MKDGERKVKPQELTFEEASFITDDGDKILLEIIKGMSLEELRSFDVYVPKYMQHYTDIQCTWLCTEKHLLQNRDGCCREVSEAELIEDIDKCHNGERFRVFYVLKYPNMVERYTNRKKK